MILAITLILLQGALAQPPASQEGELRIVSVEQTGKPPFTPEGRIYRLAGESLSRIKPGEILILKRLRDERDIGSLRVLTVHGSSATASLEVRGDTFPLKGDLAYPLILLNIPEIYSGETFQLKDNIAFPLNPAVIPPIPRIDSAVAGAGATANSPKTPQLMEAEAIKPVDTPRPLQAIIESQISGNATATRPANLENSDGSSKSAVSGEAAGQSGQTPLVEAVTPIVYKIAAQYPFYFLPESSELSPKGAEKIQQWIEEWGKTNVRYFLGVPERQIKLQKLLVDRLAALQRELARLGIPNAGVRPDNRNIAEPYEAIYVCVETPG